MQRTSSFILLFLYGLANAPLTHAQEYGPPSDYGRVLYAHGIMASVAWVVFFPLGAILIRALNGPRTIWIHAAVQVFASFIWISAAVMGVYLAATSHQIKGYHPIIGLVVFGLVLFQPISGLVHHAIFRRKQSRTYYAVVHIWLGRILITLGMINGGLGLLFAGNATRGQSIAYGIIAGIIWFAYMAIMVRFEARGSKHGSEPRTVKDQAHQGGRTRRRRTRPLVTQV